MKRVIIEDKEGFPNTLEAQDLGDWVIVSLIRNDICQGTVVMSPAKARFLARHLTRFAVERGRR